MLKTEIDNKAGWLAEVRVDLERAPDDATRGLVESRIALGNATGFLRVALNLLWVLRSPRDQSGDLTLSDRVPELLTILFGAGVEIAHVEQVLVDARARLQRGFGSPSTRYDVGAVLADLSLPPAPFSGTCAHAALWRLCALAVVAATVKVMPNDIQQHLHDAAEAWAKMAAAERAARMPAIRSTLQAWPFSFEAVERWRADLRIEWVEADALLASEFEARVARGGMGHLRGHGSKRSGRRGRRKGSLDDRARDYLATHVGQEFKVPTKAQVAAAIGEKGRRQDLSDASKCPTFFETWSTLKDEFGVNRPISPSNVKKTLNRMAEDRTGNLSDADGRERLSRVARNTSAQRQSRRDDEAES